MRRGKEQSRAEHDGERRLLPEEGDVNTGVQDKTQVESCHVSN